MKKYLFQSEAVIGVTHDPEAVLDLRENSHQPSLRADHGH